MHSLGQSRRGSRLGGRPRRCVDVAPSLLLYLAEGAPACACHSDKVKLFAHETEMTSSVYFGTASPDAAHLPIASQEIQRYSVTMSSPVSPAETATL